MSKSTSYVKRTREAKKNAQINAIALRMGIQNKNPNAIKSERFKKKWKEFKDKTISIYKGKATSEYHRKQSQSDTQKKADKDRKKQQEKSSYSAKDTTN